MKLAFILLAATLGIAPAADAANRYVRAGATGSATGADWSNAYPALPATLVRGDTYYIADGTYGVYRFNTPPSATASYIHLKKATASDHGTDTGWAPGYGDGDALFTGPTPVWQFNTGHWVVDGVVGAGKATTPYGFRVMPTTSKCANVSAVITFGDGTHITNLTLNKIDVNWNNGTSACTTAAPALLYTKSASSDEITIENSYFHDAPAYAFYIGAYNPNPGGLLQNRYAIRNNYFYKIGGGGGSNNHWELMWLMNFDNSDIYNNVIEDVIGASGQTGWVMLAKANNVNIFGNVFFCTDPNCIVGGNGVIATWSADAYRNDGISIYNNTFAKLRGVFNDFGIRFTHNSVADTNIVVRNNLYCNTRFSWSGVTAQSHEACGCGQVCSGTTQQTGLTSSIFKNYAGGNFRLTGPTSPGMALDLAIKADMDGTVRAVEGSWDRGAFEYLSTGGTVLSPPVDLRVR